MSIRESRPRGSLAVQIALVTTAVAALAVLLTGTVSLGFGQGALERDARDALRSRLEVLTATGIFTTEANRAGVVGLRRELQSQGIRVGVVFPGGFTAGFADRDVTDIRDGRQVSRVVAYQGSRWLVEGVSLGRGRGLLVSQPAAVTGKSVARARYRLLWASVAGLCGAMIIGVLLAWRIALPLRRMAAAAHRLSEGSRGVALRVEGSAEIAAVAEAITGLDQALAVSEGRQRDFLMSVSHELRTPLTAIRGYAEAMADGVLPPSDTIRVGQVLVAEAERLDCLVSDLLDLARLDAVDFRLDMQRVDLRTLLVAAGEVWRDRCSRHQVELRVEVPDGPLSVITDSVRVRQIVDGLAENALRVTPAGAPVVLAARNDGPWALVEVRDGGPGLTPGDMKIAFDRSALFERYRGTRKVGTGLGLALVAGLAHRLGGRAMAGGAVEGGAAFAVLLPREKL
jgi:two-component system, OmpR family, sensor kinase